MANLPKMRSYFDQDLMISLEIPEGWQTISNQEFKLLLQAPEEKGAQTIIGFNAGAAQPPTPETLKTLFTQLAQSDEQRYPKYKVLKTGNLDLEGNPVLFRIHQWVSPDDSTQMIQYQTALLIPPKIYAVNASYIKQLQSTYQPIVEHIVRSLRAIPPSS